MIDLSRYPYFGYDTETTGLVYPRDKAFGFSIATPDGRSEYYDIRQRPEAVDLLNRQMRSYRGIIICHNASFDYRMSHVAGIVLPVGNLDDTVIRATQIDEHEKSYALDDLGHKYLGEGKVTALYKDLAKIFGGLATKNVQMKHIARAPIEIVGPYCEQDAILALRLWEWQQEEIERQGIENICRFERHKMPTFIRAEMRGIRVDLDYAEEAADAISPIINQEQKKLNKIAGDDFNVNSSPQIKALFEPTKKAGIGWVAKDGTILGTTKTGNPSIGAEYLRSMRHPAAAHILEIRSLIKTRDTFLRKHVLGHATGGRVYPTINQSKGEEGGTSTGRLSYQGPAMQQIPSRNKKVAAIVKPCFLPEEGQVWVDADMASFEVRVFAHLINNKEIIDAYKNNPNLDLHQFVADLTNLVRNATFSGEPNAKQLNLSMIFNSGDGATADKMGMPWEWESFLPRGRVDIPENYITYKKAGIEAKRIIKKYHHRIPGVKELANGCKAKAEKRGFIRTFTGRRLRFPHGHKSYKASGLLIQATAADVNKENWSIIEETLGDYGTIILNTHDSYSMSIDEDWKPHYERVRIELERDVLRVPLKVDLNGVGKNWWDALTGYYCNGQYIKWE